MVELWCTGETLAEYVQVLVATCAGVEEITEVFQSEASEDAPYRNFAEGCDTPMDGDGKNYGWSEYTAWTPWVEV